MAMCHCFAQLASPAQAALWRLHDCPTRKSQSLRCCCHKLALPVAVDDLEEPHLFSNTCTQFILSTMLSVAYGAINGHTAFGIFALMRHIKDTGQVADTSSLGMQLRCASAVGLTLGAVLFGGRIAPVTGELLA